MTNPTATQHADLIAPFGHSCPLPIRTQDGEPVFSMDMRALNSDRYFLTIKYDDNSCYGISLMVPRTGPAKSRIEGWLKENLPGAQLEDWYMQDLEKPGRFKGLTGLMTIRVA